jgi:polysaccharide export outer membrane protein
MRKSLLKTANLMVLISLSCVSYRGVHLVNLTTKEMPSETEIVLTTTKPVQYKETKVENPPRLVISFPKDAVYGNEREELVINKGPIRKIRNEYRQGEGKSERRLNSVIVEFAQDVPYKISQSGSSIIIRIKNSNLSSLPSHEEETNIEAQLQTSGKNALIESAYLIGPGDILAIEVWKQLDVSRDVRVDEKGEIRLPPVRKISVLGLTASESEEKLTEALSKYLIDPIVFVTIKEYNSQRIIALGEIAAGMYTLKRRTTLVEFMGQIGGARENADIFHIKLIKKDGKILTYNLNELIHDPQKSEEAILSGGDTLYVPPLEINKVYVLGEVRTPKIINIKGKLNIIDAITDAGGFTPDAVTKSVIVVRGELGSQKGIRVNLNRVLKEADIGQNIELMAGDIIYVPKSFIVDIERFLRDISLPIMWNIWFIK